MERRSIMILVLAIALPMAGSGAAGASDFYVCDCGGGADSDCVAGNDSASGTDPNVPWQTYERARTRFASLAPGDSIRFCDGGFFPIPPATSARWVNNACTAAQPCTVSNYSPPWASGDEGRPRIQSPGPHAFDLANGGNAVPQEGYTFTNLDLSCVGCNTSNGWAFFFYNDIDDVLIDNVRMDGFDIGVHVGGSNSCSGNPGCDGSNDRITVRNSTIINSWGQGFLGGGNGTRIENNDFENNGTTPVFEHNIYLGGHTTGSRIIGNRLYRSAYRSNNMCEGASLVVHGVQNDLLIENNLIREDVGAASQQCWGIAVDPAYSTAESFTNVTIRGNEIRNVGNVGIGVAACSGCLIENNVIVHGQAFGITAIAAPDRTSGAGDAAMTAVRIRNNSIAVGSGGTGIYLGGEGANHEIVSNAIRHFGSDAAWACLETDLPNAAYDAIDHNLCDYPQGQWARGVGDLAAWQGTGRGANSLAADPGFVSNTDLTPRDATVALVDAGHPTLSATMDLTGAARDSAPDVGAYEFASPTPDPNACPPAPLTGCATPKARNGARLRILDRDDDRRDRVHWSWRAPAAAPGAVFDTMTPPDGYRFCLWDRDAGAVRLVTQLRVLPTGPWTVTARSHRYLESDRTTGAKKVVLRTVRDGSNRMTVGAGGVAAGAPALPVAASPSLTAQWIADGGACWTSDFSDVRQGGPGRVRAK